MFLWLVSLVGILGQLCFAVFALASGLYYLAEIIEEYTILAKKVITYLLVFVLVVYGCLLIDGLPLTLIISGCLTHLCYGSLLVTFPVISLLSFGFIGGTVCLLISHYFAFQYFATEWHTFQEVLGFFFICLWIVPFSIFISLTANDMVLPTLGGPDGANTDNRRSRRSGFLALVDLMAAKIGSSTPSRSSKSF